MATATVKILVVENDPIHTSTLDIFLRRLHYEVIVTDHVEEALQLVGNIKPDLVLLDIRLKGKTDGMDMVTKINQIHLTPVIFVASFHDNTMLEQAKSALPGAYLVKPFDEKALQKAIELALYSFSNLEEQAPFLLSQNEGILLKDSFFIKEKNKLVKVAISDILWLEVEDKYATMVTADKKFVLRLSLKELIAKLDGHDFVRIQRGFVINARKINIIDMENSLVRVGDTELPLGRKYKEDLLRRLNLLS